MADHRADTRGADAPHVGDASLTLLPVEASVPRARHFVERALPRGCWVDDVSLLVSELASNSVRHAGSAFTVSLRCDGRVVRVDVADDDARAPVVGHPAVDALAGRGLMIVDAIADRWGVEPLATGKSVWFELACPSTVEPG